MLDNLEGDRRKVSGCLCLRRREEKREKDEGERRGEERVQ